MTSASFIAAVQDSFAAATIRKIRLRLIPFLFAIFVVAFVDRINIGFAALTMNQDLAIASQQFGFLSGIFFFGYFLFEIPSNNCCTKSVRRSGSHAFCSPGDSSPP